MADTSEEAGVETTAAEHGLVVLHDNDDHERHAEVAGIHPVHVEVSAG